MEMVRLKFPLLDCQESLNQLPVERLPAVGWGRSSKHCLSKPAQSGQRLLNPRFRQVGQEVVSLVQPDERCVDRSVTHDVIEQILAEIGFTLEHVQRTGRRLPWLSSSTVDSELKLDLSCSLGKTT